MNLRTQSKCFTISFFVVDCIIGFCYYSTQKDFCCFLHHCQKTVLGTNNFHFCFNEPSMFYIGNFIIIVSFFSFYW